jgi:hypothetical protein
MYFQTYMLAVVGVGSVWWDDERGGCLIGRCLTEPFNLLVGGPLALHSSATSTSPLIFLIIHPS